MSIETAEKFKAELTDKFVVVDENVPELRRFAGLTGRVKTVNMSSRALVEFDGPVDISWYDIDPAYLTVIDEPLKKQPPAKAQAPATKSAIDTKPAAKTAKTGGGKKSPLELARQQDAAKAAAAASSPTQQPQKKLSPLELARQQDAEKSRAVSATAKTEKPAVVPQPQPAGKQLSPLERARLQDAAGKKQTDAGSDADDTPAPAAVPEKKTPATGPGGKKLSPLEIARRQDAKK
jgi:hypothetical protein